MGAMDNASGPRLRGSALKDAGDVRTWPARGSTRLRAATAALAAAFLSVAHGGGVAMQPTAIVDQSQSPGVGTASGGDRWQVLTGVAASGALAAFVGGARGVRRRHARVRLVDRVLAEVDWLLSVSAEAPPDADRVARVHAVRTRSDRIHANLWELSAITDGSLQVAALELRTATTQLANTTVNRLVAVDALEVQQLEPRLAERRERLLVARGAVAHQLSDLHSGTQADHERGSDPVGGSP